MRWLLLDRIDEVRPGEGATGWKCVAMAEDYLEWHFPERPIVPGVLVLEACVQLAGWLEAASSEFARWFLLDRVTSGRWYGFCAPGDRIDLDVKAVPCADPDRRAYRAECRVGGERRASIDFEGRVVPLATLEARDRAERAYAVLRPPVAPPARGRP